MKPTQDFVFKNSVEYYRVVKFYILKHLPIWYAHNASPSRIENTMLLTAAIYKANIQFNSTYEHLKPKLIKEDFIVEYDNDRRYKLMNKPRLLSIRHHFSNDLSAYHKYGTKDEIRKKRIKPQYFVPAKESEWLFHHIIKSVIDDTKLMTDYKLLEFTHLMSDVTDDMNIYPLGLMAKKFRHTHPLEHFENEYEKWTWEKPVRNYTKKTDN